MSQAPKTRRRWYQFTAGQLVIASVIAAGIGWLWWELHHGWSVERLERLVQAEIPQGSDRATVEVCLNLHHINFSWCDGARGDRWGNDTVEELAGLQGVEIGGTLDSFLQGKEANVGIFESGTVTLYFFFDKQGRLIGHLIKENIYTL